MLDQRSVDPQCLHLLAATAGAKYLSPLHPFDDYSITDGRVVTGANPASAHSTAARAVKAFDGL